MPAWTIHTGVEGDLPAVLALWRQTGLRPTATDSEAGLEQLLLRDPRALLLAKSEAEAIGSLIAAWDGWRGSFYRLAVHPAWRRQGLATVLIRHGEERLRQLGAERLTAIVATEEDAAMACWEAAGYTRQRDTSRFVRMLGD